MSNPTTTATNKVKHENYKREMTTVTSSHVIIDDDCNFFYFISVLVLISKLSQKNG